MVVGRRFVQNPGPTNIPDEVLEAFRRPAVDFVDPEFLRLVDGLWDELPVLFGDAADIVLYTAVGHGAWEGTLTNLLDPGERLLVLTAGLFGSEWARMAAELGFDPITVPIDLRRAPDPARVHHVLAADPEHRIRGVFVAHTETSGATRADLHAIRAAIDHADHPALFVVDAIASFGADPLSLADVGADVVLAASQKALMMPPGISFCALSQRAIDRSNEVTTPRFYWSWPTRLDYEFVYRRFGGTPPEQHLFALRAALDLIDAEGGLAAVNARHARLASATHAAIEAWGQGGPWEINATEPAERSNGLTAVRCGQLDSAPLIEHCAQHFSVSLGQPMMDMADHGFRIGHLGSLNEAMLVGALGAIETSMVALGYPFRSGLAAATERLASAPIATQLGQ